MVRLHGLAVALLLKGGGRVVVAIAIQRPSSELVSLKPVGFYHFDSTFILELHLSFSFSRAYISNPINQSISNRLSLLLPFSLFN